MFLVAHRAGNDLRRLRRAEACGDVGMVEADVRLFRGRLEVRHLKSVGPLPLYWDTWGFAAPWTTHLPLEHLLEAAARGTELLLDLKGTDVRLPQRLLDALDARPRAAVTVCSRDWRLLEPLRDVPRIRVVHSVGDERQLVALFRRASAGRLEGVSIRRRLLNAQTSARVRAVTDLLLAWPVVSPRDAALLAAWGVDGLTTDAFESLALPLG